MIRLIQAEFVKLRTTQVWFWLLMAVLAISALVVVGSLVPSDGVQSSSDVPDIFAASNNASIAVFVLGVLGVTTEFRYQTITPTVLVTPSRWTLITAKMITYALAGAAYALACIVLQLAMVLPWLATKNIDVDWGDHTLWRSLWGLFLVLALFGIVGLGVGALLRNQIVAVTLGLIFLLVLENIILAIPKVRLAWPYTPSGATLAILFTPSQGSPGDLTILSPVGGVLVLVLWALVPALIGAGITMNRDIT
jgi:ABC-2 type transport system permease protein